MKKYMLLFFIMLGCAVSMPLCAQAALMVGEQAPDFTIQDTKGTEHSLSAYKGKFIVLEWFNPDCPFVKKHYGSGNMQRLQKAYTEKGVIWLSINSSAPGKQGNYDPVVMDQLMAGKGANSTAVLLDPNGTVGRMYGAATTPHMFIIDPQGALVYQGAIDSIPGTDQSEINEADNYVEAALEAAMSGKPIEVASTKSYGCSVKY